MHILVFRWITLLIDLSETYLPCHLVSCSCCYSSLVMCLNLILYYNNEPRISCQIMPTWYWHLALHIAGAGAGAYQQVTAMA